MVAGTYFNFRTSDLVFYVTFLFEPFDLLLHCLFLNRISTQRFLNSIEMAEAELHSNVVIFREAQGHSVMAENILNNLVP